MAPSNTPQDGTLRINGQPATSSKVRFTGQRVDLPFTDLLTALGLEVNWIDENIACVSWSDRSYELNLDSETFQSVMFLLEFNVEIDIHYETLTVDIITPAY